MNVSVKTTVGDMGILKANANISRNKFYGIEDPQEPEFDIEAMVIRDSKNRVIHGYSILERAQIHSLEDWELSIIEERLVQEFIARLSLAEDSKTDLLIETLKAYY